MRTRRRILPALLLPLLLLLASQCAAQLPPSARLGRLFSSPGDRALLDSKRGATPTAPATPNGPTGETSMPSGPMSDGAGAAPPAGPAPVELNGVLRSSSGRVTTWLNAEPTSSGTPAAGGKSVALRLSSGRKLLLKPGQSYDAISGAVQENRPVPAEAAQGQPAPQPSPELRQ